MCRNEKKFEKKNFSLFFCWVARLSDSHLFAYFISCDSIILFIDAQTRTLKLKLDKNWNTNNKIIDEIRQWISHRFTHQMRLEQHDLIEARTVRSTDWLIECRRSEFPASYRTLSTQKHPKRKLNCIKMKSAEIRTENIMQSNRVLAKLLWDINWMEYKKTQQN